MWRSFDLVENPPFYLEADDKCYFARERIAGGGYSASMANNLISNFQKPVDRKGTLEWRYKEGAIRQFAYELASIIKVSIAVSCIPSSKALSDPNYDSRLDETLKELKRIRNGVTITRPFTRPKTIPSLKSGESSRDPRVLCQKLEWVGFKEAPSRIVLIDDVITSGASFKACQQLIHDNCPDTRIWGLFWCRTIWVEEDDDVEG